MKANPIDYSLLTVLSDGKAQIDKYFTDYPELKHIVDANLIVGKGYVLAIVQTVHEAFHLEMMYMIQRQHGYYENSVVLLLQGQLDEALAILRMAMELSRDILVLSKDSSLMPLWSNREKEYQKYRKKFKFDGGYSPNKHAHELYKLTSQFGVHGHLTTIGQSSKFNFKNSHKSGLVEQSMTTGGIANIFTIWLSAFFAIYGNLSDCIKILSAHTELTLSLSQSVSELSIKNGEVIDYLKEKSGEVVM